MIDPSKKYTPVLNHVSIQVIMPYELFKVLDVNTKEVLWYEVTYKNPKTFDDIARHPFAKESAARDYIIQQIENKHQS